MSSSRNDFVREVVGLCQVLILPKACWQLMSVWYLYFQQEFSHLKPCPTIRVRRGRSWCLYPVQRLFTVILPRSNSVLFLPGLCPAEMLSGHRSATQRQGLAFCAIIAAGCLTPFIDAASPHTEVGQQDPDARNTGAGESHTLCNLWSGTL